MFGLTDKGMNYDEHSIPAYTTIPDNLHMYLMNNITTCMPVVFNSQRNCFFYSMSRLLNIDFLPSPFISFIKPVTI